MSITSLAVLGGDLRQCYLAEYMHAAGHEVTCYGTVPFSFSENHLLTKAHNLAEAVMNARLVLCPMPFSLTKGFLNMPFFHPATISLEELLDVLAPGQLLVGGDIPEDFRLSCARKQIPVLDLMENEGLLLENADLTAEGLLVSLIGETSFSLKGRRVLLLGFGRCGSAIARRLLCFDMELSVMEQNPDNQKMARMEGIAVLNSGFIIDGITSPNVAPASENFSAFDIVINTIPAQVLTSMQLARLPKHCVLFDIASAPFGFTPESARELGLKLVRCPGIPGKMMPRSAGEMIGKVILERMSSYGF